MAGALSEWRPETLPVGSVVLVIGDAGVGKTTMMIDMAWRSHERYTECIVWTDGPVGAEPWRRAGYRVEMVVAHGLLDRVLVPGPDRLCIIEDSGSVRFVLAHEVRQLRERARMCRVTIVVSQTWPLFIGSQVDCCVLLDSIMSDVGVLYYDFFAPHKRLHETREDFDRATDRLGRLRRRYACGLGALVGVRDHTTGTLECACVRAVDRTAKSPTWEPWLSADARAWWTRAPGSDLKVGDSPLADDLVAMLAARYGHVGVVARTCRQWRRAVDSVERAVETRRSARFPGSAPNVWRPARGGEWDGRLRRIII